MADKKVDPRIFIPNIGGFSYIDNDLEDNDAGGGISDDTNVVVPTSPIGGGLMPPDNMQIVEQITRKTADGKTVVDLVVEVTDMPGATEYEIRRAIV